MEIKPRSPRAIRIGRAVAVLLLAAAVLVPRLFDLGAFVTVDEATWLMRSGNFYYALAQRDFERTVTAYHPAVTTTWIGALGTLIEFPDYRGQGQGYFIKETRYAEFLADSGVDPLSILRTSRLLLVGINTGLLLSIAFYLYRLLGAVPAGLGIFLLAFDPFLLGHTRVLAHEGMLSLLVVLSLAAALRYLFHGGGWKDLIVSGAAAAFAMLTKSTGTILLPAVMLLFAWKWVLDRRVGGAPAPGGSRTGPLLRGFAIWVATAAVVYFAAWPAMWTAPGAALGEVYRNAFSYALAGHQSGLTAPSAYPELDLGSAGVQRYLGSMLWRTTPTTWVGLVLGVLALAGGSRDPAGRPARRILAVFLLFAVGFVGFMSVAGGRRSAHYVLSAYAALDVAAALGLFLAFQALRLRLPGRSAGGWASAAGGVLLLAHAAAGAAYAPYYFNYANPVTRTLLGPEQFETGYGEVLELAAAYLARKPGADQLTVLAWYGIGPFSYFFPGQTELIAPGAGWTLSQVERLDRSEYLVLYYHHQVVRDMPASLLAKLAGTPYEHAIWRNGIEYVRIYRVADLPDSIWLPDPVAPVPP